MFWRQREREREGEGRWVWFGWGWDLSEATEERTLARCGGEDMVGNVRGWLFLQELLPMQYIHVGGSNHFFFFLDSLQIEIVERPQFFLICYKYDLITD